MQRSGLTEIISLTYISVIWGQYPVFSHPVSLELTIGNGYSLAARLLNYPRVHQLTSSLPAEAAITDDSEILCVLTWQATFHFSLYVD